MPTVYATDAWSPRNLPRQHRFQLRVQPTRVSCLMNSIANPVAARSFAGAEAVTAAVHSRLAMLFFSTFSASATSRRVCDGSRIVSHAREQCRSVVIRPRGRPASDAFARMVVYRGTGPSYLESSNRTFSQRSINS